MQLLLTNKLSAILDAEALNLKRGMINPCTVCPTCEGGRYKERSYSVGLSDDGVLWGKCWRASCGFTWSINDSSKWLTHLDQVVPKKEEKTFEWPKQAPNSSSNLRYLFQQSSLNKLWSAEEIEYLDPSIGWLYLDCSNNLVCSLSQPTGSNQSSGVGYVLQNIPGVGAKFRKTYLKEGYPALGIAVCNDSIKKKEVVLVEDWFSAHRLCMAKTCSATLCGTELNQAKIDQLKAAGFTSGTLCLDYDASDKAIELARKWAPYFPLKVHLIPKDFKDMTVDEFTKYKP